MTALDLRLAPPMLAAWAVTVLGIVGGWKPAAIAAVVLAGAALCLRRRFVLAAVCVVGAGFALAVTVRMHAVATHPLTAAPADRQVTATIVLTDDPRLRNGTVVAHATLRAVEIGGTATRLGGSVVVLAHGGGWTAMVPGQQVRLRASVAEPKRADLTVAVLQAQGPPLEVGRAPPVQRLAGFVRTRFAEAAARTLPPASAALLTGLVVGDTSRLPADVEADFRTAGLVHLTAVSGSNVAIVIGAVLLSMRALTLGPRASVVVAAVALGAFVIIARPSPSVLRAAVMGAIGLLAMVTSRRKQAMPALGASVLFLLAVSPGLAVDYGFVLSVGATAGLILLAPSWADALRNAGWPRAPAEAVAVSGAAFVVTTPVIAAMSGTVSTVSIVANVLVAAVVAPATVLGAIAALVAAISPLAGGLIAWCAEPGLWWLLTVADHAAALPAASITVPGGGFGVVALTFGTAAGLVAWWVRATRCR